MLRNLIRHVILIGAKKILFNSSIYLFKGNILLGHPIPEPPSPILPTTNHEDSPATFLFIQQIYSMKVSFSKDIESKWFDQLAINRTICSPAFFSITARQNKTNGSSPEWMVMKQTKTIGTNIHIGSMKEMHEDISKDSILEENIESSQVGNSIFGDGKGGPMSP